MTAHLVAQSREEIRYDVGKTSYTQKLRCRLKHKDVVIQRGVGEGVGITV